MKGVYERPEKIETNVIRIRTEDFLKIRKNIDPKKEMSWTDIMKKLIEKYNI